MLANIQTRRSSEMSELCKIIIRESVWLRQVNHHVKVR